MSFCGTPEKLREVAQKMGHGVLAEKSAALLDAAKIIENLQAESPTDLIESIGKRALRAQQENERLRAALESLTKDPPATLAREPDTDAEVIIKMRAIARAALSTSKGTES